MAVPHRAQREAALHIARGGPPTRKPGSGHPPALTLAEQVLVTVLRLRFGTPQQVLATLLGVSIGTIATAGRQTAPLLDGYGPPTPPAPMSIRTLADPTAYAGAHGITLAPKIKPAR